MTGPEIKLEKNVDAKLDTNEKANLEKLTAQDFKNQLQKLKDEKFDLSAKNKGVRLEDIVKNYDTSMGTIDIKGEKIPVGRGTDLAAWIQVLMVADGRNIKINTDKSKRGIDGKIGTATIGQIENYKDISKAEDKPGKEKLAENVLDDAAMKSYISSKNIYNITTNELGQAEADFFKSYKITGDNGKFLNASGINNKLTINYKTPQSKDFQKVVIDYKNITANDGSVDNNKLVNTIKNVVLQNDKNLIAKTGQESVGSGVEDVEVKSFSSFIQEYIESQGRETNGEIDFKPGIGNGSGMTVSNGFVTINFPGHGNVSWKLSDMQTDNKFDQDKFVTKTSEKMTPRARTWKSGELAKSYNKLNKNPIGAINTTEEANKEINSYKDLQKNIDKYSKIGVVVDSKITAGIEKKISEVEKKKEYIKMKNSDESKVKGFEDFLSKKTPKTAGEQMTFQNEINSKKGEYKSFRDDFNNRASLYIKVSYADFVNFNDRLKKIDKTYGYSN